MTKLILITGVSQGLGRIMAEQFIKLGYTVVGCSRNQQEIEKLQQQFGTSHHFISLDITNEVAIKAWAEVVHSKYDTAVDLLINNAGIVHPLAPLWTIESAVFDRVIDVNIKGVANIIRHFVPAMVKQSRGVIVNFSAGWGRYTAPNAAPYFGISTWSFSFRSVHG